MRLLSRLIQKFKKNKTDMITEDQLIGYKQNFTGQKFQWIKTPRPELLGKIVTCRDVQPAGNSAIAIFDDSSSIDVKKLTNDLLMIMGDQQPLTREEVNSIYSQNIPKVEPMVSSEARVFTSNPDRSGSDQIRESTPKNSPPKANPFLMFNSEESEFVIKMNIRLPDKKLLKMMYNSAEDKAAFLDQLSEYVSMSINNKIISDSLHKMLDSSVIKPVNSGTKLREEIKLTEVRDE